MAIPVIDPSILRPCPFCGGRAYYVRSVNDRDMHHIGCGPCGIVIKASEVHCPNPEASYITKDIVAVWNRRTEGG